MTSPNLAHTIYKSVKDVPIPVFWSDEVFQEALDYQHQPDDLFIVTYPKCGTTWTQMIVYLIKSKGVPPRSEVDFFSKMPFLDMFGTESVHGGERPFALKTHVPLQRLRISDKAKYIYVARNPKDTLVSLYRFARTVHMYEDGNFDDYFELFMEGKAEYGDYFVHTLSWQEIRKQHNVLFLTYEELKQDTKACILRIASFMGEEYAKNFEEDPSLIDKVLKYSSLEYMRGLLNETSYVNAGKPLTVEAIEALPQPRGIKYALKYKLEHGKLVKKHEVVGKGEVGGGKAEMNGEQIRRIDEMTESMFKNTEVLRIWKELKCV